MKKLVAFLTVCAVITGAFASCGSEEKEESESEKDISVSESSEEETTEETESETEEETESETEEETQPETEEETEPETEEETEPETEEETESETSYENSAGENVSDASVVGMWIAEDDDLTTGFNFKEDGNTDMFIDMTDVTHFTSDGKIFLDGEIFESDCISYDGTTLAVTVNEQDAFTMVKDSGSADGFDGIYTMQSGVIYDSLKTSVDASTEVLIIVSGEKLYSGYKDMLQYSADNGTIKITGLESIGMEDGDIESPYEINGDVLTINDFYGDKIEMKKIDF